MSPKNVFTDDYNTRLRAMEAAFNADMKAGLRDEDREFTQSLVRRPRNPHITDATDALRTAMLNGDIQQNTQPGLRIQIKHLKEKGPQILLQTKAMHKAARGLIVFQDLSCLYVEGIKSSVTTKIWVLPTPLMLRGSQQRKNSKEKYRIEIRPVWGSLASFRLMLSEHTIFDGHHLAGGTSPKAPLASDEAMLWLNQLDQEVEILSKRLAGLAPYQMRTPAIRNPLGRLMPSTGKLRSISSPTAQAFLMRQSICDDDAHLGIVAFDPETDDITLLRDILQLVADDVYCDWDAQFDGLSLNIGLDAASVTSEKAEIRLTVGRWVDQDALKAQIIEAVGENALALASRYYAVHVHEHVAGQQHYRLPLAAVSSRTRAISMHERLAGRAKIEVLQAEARARLDAPAASFTPYIAAGSHAGPTLLGAESNKADRS